MQLLTFFFFNNMYDLKEKSVGRRITKRILNTEEISNAGAAAISNCKALTIAKKKKKIFNHSKPPRFSELSDTSCHAL